MLTSLELIDWGQFGYPQIPEWLAHLQSPNQWIRNDSYSKLQSRILYGNASFQDIDLGFGAEQIFSSEILLLLAPCLIAHLREAQKEAYPYLLSFLGEAAGFVRLEHAQGIFLERASRLHEIIWGGLDEYLRILQRSNEHLAVTAGWLLCEYPEHFRHLYPIMLTTIKRLSEDKQRARLLWYVYRVIAQQEKMPEDFSRLLMQATEAEDYPISSVTAAICFVDRFRKNAPEQAINNVVQLVADIDAHRYDAGGLPPGYEYALIIMREEWG